MKYATRMGICCMFSLVQASTELLTLLDRIMLLCKGRIIYIGKPFEAEAYLKSIGFVRPEKKAVPQFLEELSSKPEQFWRDKPKRSIGMNQQQQQFQGVGREEQKVGRDTIHQNDEELNPREAAFNHLVQSYENSQEYKATLARVEAADEHSRSKKGKHKKNHNDKQSLNSEPATMIDNHSNFPSALPPSAVIAASDQNQPAFSEVSDPSALPDHQQQQSHASLARPTHSWPMSSWYEYYNSGMMLQFKQNLHRQTILTYRKLRFMA